MYMIIQGYGKVRKGEEHMSSPEGIFPCFKQGVVCLYFVTSIQLMKKMRWK
jgi:hypothetical protein